jgi:hypothetical protein
MGMRRHTYDLQLSRRLTIIKSSLATSRIKWLNGEKTNFPRTISVLVLRVLKWLDIPARAPCIYMYICMYKYDTDGNSSHFSTLRTRTDMVLGKLVFSPFNHLMRLLAREDFIIIKHYVIYTVELL